MTGYYDLVLGAIPLTLLGITGSLAFATDLALTTALTVAAIVTTAVILHALFVNAPVDARSTPADSNGSESSSTSTLVDAD